jgi:hypothetical protein
MFVIDDDEAMHAVGIVYPPKSKNMNDAHRALPRCSSLMTTRLCMRSALSRSIACRPAGRPIPKRMQKISYAGIAVVRRIMRSWVCLGLSSGGLAVWSGRSSLVGRRTSTLAHGAKIFARRPLRMRATPSWLIWEPKAARALVADCPKRGPVSVYDRRKAVFEGIGSCAPSALRDTVEVPRGP